MGNLATNRQKKLLRFFGFQVNDNLTTGAAGFEISRIMSDNDLRERWRKYLFLTQDYDSDSDQLKPFDSAKLLATIVPEDWHSSNEIQKLKGEIAAQIVNETPFDQPQPDIEFSGATFAFTGKFEFGTRDDCRDAVKKLGATAIKKPTINRNIDYLVIGIKGSPHYKRDSYGNKIQDAVISRREHGSPAIVSEDHWVSQIARVE